MNKNLGRGLSAFLDDVEEPGNDIVKLDVEKIHPNPLQPRVAFDEEKLKFLADSIKRNGVIQPILVIKTGDESYQLVAGERRLRAAKIAQLSEIPAIITTLNRENQFEIAIIENIQRENLNIIEEAEAYRKLINDFGRTQEDLSNILGKSRSHIANILRLLTLPSDVKELIKSEKLTFGHARSLIGLENASEIANKIVAENMNVRATEEFVKTQKTDGGETKKRQGYVQRKDPELDNITQHLSALIGLTTDIKPRGRGGIIEIKFNNLNELDELMSRLNNKNF